MNRQPVWEWAGMKQWEYARLPWPKKKAILRRFNGIGKLRGAWHDVRHFFKWNLYERWRRPDFSLLFKAWCQHNAEDHTIVNNYPNANLSCGHRPRPIPERPL